MIWNCDRKGLVSCGKKLTTALCLLIISLYSLHPAAAGADESEAPDEKRKETFLSKTLRTESGGRFLPIPIFITEPAIGYGLGIAVGYIYPEKNNEAKDGIPTQYSLDSIADGRTGRKPPPTITAVGGGYTDKDSWAVAVGHQASWRQDTIRFTGGLAFLDVKSSFYILNRPIDFKLRGTGLYSDIKFRLGGSGWFLGGKLGLFDSEAKFDTRLTRSGDVALDHIEPRNVGLAVTATYDSRDNTFTPNNGQLLELDLWRFDKGLGGHHNYWKGKLKMLSFHQLGAKFVLGLRGEMAYLEGQAPFYAYPWVKLRGIRALRYQGKRAGMLEAEVRWNFLPRWALLGFAGAGAVHYGGSSSFDYVKNDIYAGGMGVRYFLMQDLGLWLGVDVARGPEDWYSYITVGHTW